MIVDDIRDILIQAAPEKRLDSKLYIIMVVKDTSDSECQSCLDAVSTVINWISDRSVNGSVRLVLVDAIDDKRMWSKLRIYNNVSGMPKSIICDNRMSIIDIVQGVMSASYMDEFLLKYLLK